MNGFLIGVCVGSALCLPLGMVLLATLQAFNKRDRDNLQKTYDLMTGAGGE